MSPRARRWLKGPLLGLGYSLAVGLGFMLVVRGRPHIDQGDVLTLICASLLVTALMTVAFMFVMPAGRGMSLIPAVLLRASALGCAVLVGILGGIWIANVIDNGFARAGVRFAELLHSQELRTSLIFAFAMLLVFMFMSGISQKLGPGVLRNWLLGRYHHPRQEDRIFMFLDLRGSTALAEKLGDLKFSALIRDVFRDITTPLLECRAEVSHFIGDEVVVTWPMRRGIEDAACVRCYFAVVAELARLAGQYEATYGVTPSFKAGMHCGPVVATEVGEIKSEIVFHGDVLNIASRLQGLCTIEQADILISQDLANAVPAPEGIKYETLGPREVKGKSLPLQVVRVTRAPQKVRDGGSS